MKFLVINGPNLNFLGIREKAIYGNKTYQDLVDYLESFAKEKNISLEVLQTNSEGKIIDYLQMAHYNNYDYVLLNAGAYTHYSYAIRDAIASIKPQVIEVHLSDITKREAFRKVSVIQDVCSFSVMGLGFDSYTKAIEEVLK